MKFDFSRMDVKDWVLIGTVVISMVTSAISYGKQSAQVNAAMLDQTNQIKILFKELTDVKIDVASMRNTNFDQSLLIREITVNVQNLAETIRDIKKKQDWDERER